jgi:F0F1-type ATP synthase assembly protein I
MANQLRTLGAKAQNNPLGLLVGAGAGFLVAKKLIKTQKTWVLVATSIVGAVAGVLVQSKMKAKASQPTAKTVGI